MRKSIERDAQFDSLKRQRRAPSAPFGSGIPRDICEPPTPSKRMSTSAHGYRYDDGSLSGPEMGASDYAGYGYASGGNGGVGGGGGGGGNGGGMGGVGWVVVVGCVDVEG